MTRLHRAVVLAGAMTVPGVAAANDSYALRAAGGIVLTRSADVVMESEELWVSSSEIKVAYVFRNTSGADLKARVAFPVPEFEAEPDGDIQLDVASKNPMKFVLRVDGKPRPFETEIKRKRGMIKVTHHWEQVFPADRPLAVEHEYVPVTGSFMTDGEPNADLEEEMRIKYCVGPGLLAAVRRPNVISEVHYILTTGANWKGPIRKFKLTIAKDRPQDKVSTCIPDTRRTSPTTFVVERTNFTPTQDLRLLFIPGR